MPTQQMPDGGGVFSTASIASLNHNATLEVTTDGGQTISGALTLTGALTAASAAITGALSAGSLSFGPTIQTAAGSADAVTFASALNICVFTSTGPDTATLAVPAAGDAGKILILVNTNTTQNTCATTTNKFLIGTASTYTTLTAPAHAGAVIVLVASSGFWNIVVGGTGTWVLS